LRPQVDQILRAEQEPPAAIPMTRSEQLRRQAARGIGPLKTLTMAQIRAGAAAHRITVQQAIEDAKRQGYTIVP